MFALTESECESAYGYGRGELMGIENDPQMCGYLTCRPPGFLRSRSLFLRENIRKRFKQSSWFCADTLYSGGSASISQLDWSGRLDSHWLSIST